MAETKCQVNISLHKWRRDLAAMVALLAGDWLSASMVQAYTTPMQIAAQSTFEK